MKTNLYIPKTITVGFQSRVGTFTGKLGFVVYTDHKGVLRKETSWNNWRDLKIEPVTFDNDPQVGFCLNKGIQRDGYWGNGRSVIRVHDPRNFEFEISIDNLVGILMHADVSKRDIAESCVFAWSGTELILLPTNSEEYQESVRHTNKQLTKFSSRSLVVGYTYNTRDSQNPVVYLGYLPRWDVGYVDSSPHGHYNIQQKYISKSHMFIDPMTKRVSHLTPSTHISGVNCEQCHEDFGALLDHYYTTANSQKWTGGVICPITRESARFISVQLSATEFAMFIWRSKNVISLYEIVSWNGDSTQFEIATNRADDFSIFQYFQQSNATKTYTTSARKKVLKLAEEMRVKIENKILSEQGATPQTLWDDLQVGSIFVTLENGCAAVSHITH